MENMVGLKFGRLLVLERPSLVPKTRQYLCKCKCDCGNVVFADAHRMRHGRVKSCGCLRRAGTFKKPFGEASFDALYTRYKGSAKRRKISFHITKDKFRVITSSNCHYCNAPPSRFIKTSVGHYNGNYLYNGIDRIDSDGGYTHGNVVPCCAKCNLMKSAVSYSEFIGQCLAIAKHQAETG